MPKCDNFNSNSAVMTDEQLCCALQQGMDFLLTIKDSRTGEPLFTVNSVAYNQLRMAKEDEGLIAFFSGVLSDPEFFASLFDMKKFKKQVRSETPPPSPSNMSISPPASPSAMSAEPFASPPSSPESPLHRDSPLMVAVSKANSERVRKISTNHDDVVLDTGSFGQTIQRLLKIVAMIVSCENHRDDVEQGSFKARFMVLYGKLDCINKEHPTSKDHSTPVLDQVLLNSAFQQVVAYQERQDKASQAPDLTPAEGKHDKQSVKNWMQTHVTRAFRRLSFR